MKPAGAESAELLCGGLMLAGMGWRLGVGKSELAGEGESSGSGPWRSNWLQMATLPAEAALQ